MRNIKEKWENELNSEVKFWDEWLRERANTDLSLDNTLIETLNVDVIKSCLEGIIEPKILDVGSGATSFLANLDFIKKDSITAIDYLANEYTNLCEELNISRPVVPISVEVEYLDKVFFDNTFDFIHINNSLDHCFAPMEVINSLVKIAKPNTPIFFKHYRNVGEIAQYTGLHQFDIDIIDGEPCIDKEPIKDNLKIPCQIEIIAQPENSHWVEFIIKKI